MLGSVVSLKQGLRSTLRIPQVSKLEVLIHLFLHLRQLFDGENELDVKQVEKMTALTNRESCHLFQLCPRDRSILCMPRSISCALCTGDPSANLRASPRNWSEYFP
jgi:hypothetical protein